MSETAIDTPDAIVPVYLTPAPNQPIHLYSGPMRITQGSATYSGEGTLLFGWLPKPGIEFHWMGSTSPRALLEGITISFPQLGTSAKAYLTSIPYFAGQGDVTGCLEEPLILGESRNLKEVVFHLTNFHHYTNGGAIRFVSSEYNQHWLGRLSIKTEEWRITIDSLKDSYGLSEATRLKRAYAITHVGRLERIDDRTFTGMEANRVLEALFFFLSFVRGFWVAPILPVGFDERGEGVWQSWGDHLTQAWQHVDSWFPLSRPNSIVDLFSGFLKWFQNPIWNEPLRLAIQWYVECNLNAGRVFSSLPAAIVMEQVALEMLSWVRFVEDEQSHSRSQFNKFLASEKLKLLLTKFNLPLPVPNELQTLSAAARVNKWSTGPQALTVVRNRIVHSSPDNRQQVRDLSHLSILETWKLGLWYIELILLSLFEYRGVYHNRLRRNRNLQDVEPVPWMCSGA